MTLGKADASMERRRDRLIVAFLISKRIRLPSWTGWEMLAGADNVVMT